MANNETVLKIKAQIDGLQGLEKLKSSMKRISAEVDGAENNFSELLQKLKQLQASSVKSINNLNAQRDAFEALRRSVDLNSKEFKEARDEIEKIDRALKEASGTVVKYSKNSINALRAQKNELLAVRDSADLMSKEFKEAGVELAKLDKKLAKAEGRGRGGRLRAGAQIAGTVAGAGVFGGPEGAIGALGGGLIGGVGGAVLGGALGAQVGQLREAAGGVAEYVAELNLAKGALGGVSKDIVEYNQNLDFAREISKKYAIRLTDVIKGYTGVTAAAKANNLSVKQTQAIYEGITVSGVAAGKSQEDLQALFLATTQVLSKGKASAEEISGQIGERIPGAVAKFAAANKISLQELAEQFKKGEVTIAKFVRFTEQQGEDYAEVAEALASGPEKAGVRLQIALDEAGEVFGGFFLNTGAGFQDLLQKIIDFTVNNEKQIKTIIGGVVVLYKDISSLLKDLADGIAETFGPVFTFLINGIDAVVGKAVGAINTLLKLQQIDQKTVERIKKESREQVEGEYSSLLEEKLPFFKGLGASLTAGDSGPRFQEVFNKRMQAELDKVTLGPSFLGRAEQQGESLFPEYVPSKLAGPNKITPPAAADLDGDGEGKKTGKTKRPARADFRDLEAAFARDAAEKVQKAEVALRIKIAEAQKQENKELVFALTQERELLKVNQVISSLREQIRQRAIQITEAQGKGLDVSGGIRKQLSDQQKLNSAILEKSARTAELSADRLGREKEITAELDKQRKSFEEQFTDRQKELGLISSSDYNKILLARKKEELADPRLGLSSEQQSRGLDQFRQTIDPTVVEGLTQNIRSLKTELEDLVNPINQITGAANAIGSAFSQSFTNAITGATSAKQALSDFFKSVASYFLDMAGQIIAKMVTIAILNAALGLFGGSSGGGGFNPGAPSITGNSLGDFGGGSFGGFMANGGPVSANTPYIVGERGPELMVPSGNGTIIPNDVFSASRAAISGGGPLGAAGNSGDLGKDGMVESRNYISNNYSTQQAIAQSQAAVSSSSMSMERVIERKAAERQATEMSEPIRVKLDTTVINNVEYLTVEQGLALSESASRKARSQVFSDLRQRPALRSKVGLG
jgi:tape measure domain-containing protein